MAYLTIARIDGDPDRLLDGYRRTAERMDQVGHDHGLVLHAGARTDAGLLIVNLWPSRDGSQAAAADPRRLAAMRQQGALPRAACTRSTTRSSATSSSPRPPPRELTRRRGRPGSRPVARRQVQARRRSAPAGHPVAARPDRAAARPARAIRSRAAASPAGSSPRRRS